MNIAAAILGLALLIFVHELGHFLASLALGMRPRRFYVGFPPAVWKTTRGGIEYALGAIPLGGFVKIPGMHRPLAVDADTAFGRVVAEAPGLARDVARVRGALEADDYAAVAAALEGMRDSIERTHLSQRGQEAAARGIEDLGDAIGRSAYWRAPTWRRVAVIAAGPLANVALTIVLVTGLLALTDATATTRVERVAAGSPAATAGVLAGDRIVSIDGHPVEPKDVAMRVGASAGRPVALVVERNQARVALTPVAARREGTAWRLGVTLGGEPLPPGRAAISAVELTAAVSLEIARSIGQLTTSKGREGVASPIGIVQGSSQAAARGLESFVGVLALLSLSIALLNLLPFLPLDGGHIVFAAAEAVRRKAVPRVAYERASLIGIGLVLLLFVIGLSNDLERLGA
ncbi:MAG: RIP metalloprotease RseP [Thermoleophilia bacterium]|nr:RIP metalloprotease RseP [Thermoleophilia bacterium]